MGSEFNGEREVLHEAIRREAFVQGFVAARAPKTALETLLVCTDADVAYAEWRAQRR